MRANPFEGQLERLARTLTEQFGVNVVCQGDNAWTDGRQIVLPSLPELLNENLERMMVGYLDHEMAHVAFSDFGVAKRFAKKHPGFEGMLNVVEDALIERRAMERWPGVRRNLDLMFEQIKDKVLQLIQQRGPFDRFCTAVYLKLCHHGEMLGLDGELAGYNDLLNEFPAIQQTADAARLAERLLERWLRNQPPSPTQGKGKPPPELSGEQSHSKPAKSNGASGPGGTAQGSGERVSDARSPGSSKADGSGSASKPDAAQAGTNCSGDQSTNDHVATGRNAGGLGSSSLVSQALTDAIAERVQTISGAHVYRPLTRQHDRIQVVPDADHREVQQLLQTGTDTVRRLRRGLTTALRSLEKHWWWDDQSRGALSPRTLHRLCMDRPRLDVFRTRVVIQGQSTAVSMLLDASGSMTSRKMDVARSAMRVLLEALADLRIATEALSFTTGNEVDLGQITHETGLDPAKLRERYGRLSNLEIGLIKQFDEPVKAALSRLPAVRGTGLTPLGEAMKVAASRLMPRPEQRKILLVLTDGKAGCEGDGEAATVYAQETARRIVAAGIELVGVGIQDESVCTIVKDSIVIHVLTELPAQLCKLLGRTLQKGMCHVG